MGVPNAKIKHYPNGTDKITIFNYPRFAEKPPKEIERIPTEYNTDNPRVDNIKRAKDKIFDIAYLNADIWTYMITFTLDKMKIDRYDINVIKPKIRKWLNNAVNRKGLCYLIVPEFHKDGAIHFHGFINDCDFNFKKTNKKDKQGREVYNITDYPFGFSTAVKLDDNKIGVSKYITKYVTKDFQKIFGQCYLAGGKIERDLPCEYVSVDYSSFDVQEFEIPNTDIKIKYAVCGVFFDD